MKTILLFLFAQGVFCSPANKTVIFNLGDSHYIVVPDLALSVVDKSRPQVPCSPKKAEMEQSVHRWSFLHVGSVFGPVKVPVVVPGEEIADEIGYDATCGVRWTDTEDSIRIVGGSNALPGEFPWQVSLQTTIGVRNRHFCGGTIISRYWVITAAHCLDGFQPSRIIVVAGDLNLYEFEGPEQVARVVRIVKKGFRKESFTNDIALLQVSPGFRFDGKFVAPLCLPRQDHSVATGFGVVSGWGRLSEKGRLPEILQSVPLPLISKRKCDILFSDFASFRHSCQLCSGFELGGHDSCQGDSGGPLACKKSDGRYYLCGVVSWGVGCARPNSPGVYTKVPCYSSWIKNVIYSKTNRELAQYQD